MLKDADIKKINNVCIAENAKKEGISLTAKRILNAGENTSISDVIKESYKELISETKQSLDDYYPGHYKHLIAYMNVGGFFLFLPFNLAMCSFFVLGAEFKTSILMLSEKKYLSDLVSSGVIEEKDIPKLLKKISHLKSFQRTSGLYRNMAEDLIENDVHDDKGSIKL